MMSNSRTVRAVLIGSIAFALSNCQDNSLAPHQVAKTPHALADEDPSAHVQTGTLAAGDGTVGPVVFSGDPYIYPTLVQVTADGIISRNYSNFPYLWWDDAGKPAPPLDPGGEFIWSIYYQCVGNDIIEFINDDGSHGGYVGFCDSFNQLDPQSSWTAPWQVVTGQAQGSRNGGYAQARYSCGGPQDDPCYTYSGSQTVTVTPASADLDLEADKTDVGEGDQVTFTGTITPDSVGGIPVPYSNVQWSWQSDDGIMARRVHLDPRASAPSATKRSGSVRPLADEVENPDSVDLSVTFEGDLPDDDRSPTVACAGASLTCQMTINGSGTVTLVAIVNGAQKTKSAHVTVTYYCPEVFDYPQDPIVLATPHKRTWPEGVPLGDGPVEFAGPYTIVGDPVGGTPFPIAMYRPSSGDDFAGDLLFAPVTVPGWYPGSVAYFECQQTLKLNSASGEYELRGPMKFANRVDLYFYHPTAPPGGRVVSASKRHSQSQSAH